MKSFVKEFGSKMDGITEGCRQGLIQVRDRIHDSDGEASDFKLPPQFTPVPSEEGVQSAADASNVRSFLKRTDAISESRKIRDRGDPSDLDPLCELRPMPVIPDVPWWKAEDSLYLCICVKEAKGLAVVDHSCMSTSSSVKIEVGPEKSPVMTEQTRVCHRNKNPLWGQNFFFPLDELHADTRMCISVHATNVGAINILDHSGGQVTATLGHMLDTTDDVMDTVPRWYKLMKKKKETDGELLIVVTVVSKFFYDAVYWSEDATTLMDPIMQKSLLKDYTLHADLKEVRQLRFNINDEDYTKELDKLSIQIRFGTVKLNCKLSPKDITVVSEGPNIRVLTIKINQQVSLPLEKGFEETLQKITKRHRDEAGEIKIALLHGEVVLAETQVPVWDVPVVEEEADQQLEAGDADEAEPEEKDGQKSSGGAAKLDVQHSQRKTACQSAVGTFFQEMAKSNSTARPTSGPPPLESIPSGKEMAPEISQISMLKSRRRAPDPPGLSTVSMPVVPESAVSFSSNSSGGYASKPETRDQSTPANKMQRLTGLALARNLMRIPKGAQQYNRLMEPYVHDVVLVSPELQISMHLATTKLIVELVTEESGDGEGAEGEGDAVEVVPIPLPANLAVFAAEVVVAGKPNAVFDTCFGVDSTFRKDMVNLEALRDVVTGGWSADADKSQSSGYKGVKTRSMTYVRPLNIPMAPKQCNVQEIQWMIAREAGGFVFEKKVTTNAPMGDTFYMIVQVTGAPVPGMEGTKVSISFKIEWVKNPFLKGVIEGGAISGTKKIMIELADELLKALGPPVASHGKAQRPAADGTAGPQAANEAMPRNAVHDGRGAAAPVAAPSSFVLVLAGAAVALLAVLLLVMLAKISALTAAVRSQQQLTEASERRNAAQAELFMAKATEVVAATAREVLKQLTAEGVKPASCAGL